MSNTQCLVRISDHLLWGEPAPNVVNPDTNTYMEVTSPLADVGSHLTRNYRWNVKESKFYDAGLKDQAGPEATQVVLKPFAVTDNYFYRGQGFNFTVPASSTQSHDILISEERAIDGSEIWLGSNTYGCKANFKVMDLAGVYAPAGTMLNQFAFDWNIHPNTMNKEDPGYPAILPDGVYVRVEVTNPSASEIKVYGNLRLHEHKDDV